MKKILMVAFECERWGPARLPQPLTRAGVEVAVLCADENPLAHSGFAAKHYKLEGLKSSRSFGRTLGKAMNDWQPDLVIPCDEPIAVMLHYLLKNQGFAERCLGSGNLAVLQRSIGHTDKLDTMILKYHTRVLAESLGIPVPKSQLVRSEEEATEVAQKFGYPVFLKKSFSWAGRGSMGCNNAAEVQSGFQSMHTKTPWYKQAAKNLLGRTWFPVDTEIEVQKAIDGESVMYNVAALEGKVLAGIFGRRTTKLSQNGPSTIVEISDNEHCRKAAEKMIAAMGASGFLAFDFMICAKTGNAYLLECNPRPNQVCHLGHHIGADLCAALGAALNNRSATAVSATGDHVVPLFPQEWLRDEKAALAFGRELDIPASDPKLFDFMLRTGKKRGHSIDNLLSTLKAQGVTVPDYTFV